MLKRRQPKSRRKEESSSFFYNKITDTLTRVSIYCVKRSHSSVLLKSAFTLTGAEGDLSMQNKGLGQKRMTYILNKRL